MKIIAFSGKATSGKTAAALFLGKKLMAESTIFCKVSFADALRRMAMDYFPVTADDLKNRKNDLITLGGKEMTIRQLLIDLGCKMREIQPDFWVQSLMRQIETITTSSFNPEPPEVVVAIDDMRFPNEYDLLKERGALLVRIERPGVKLIDDISETSLDSHEFDAYIENNGTLEELEKMVLNATNDFISQPLSTQGS